MFIYVQSVRFISFSVTWKTFDWGSHKASMS